MLSRPCGESFTLPISGTTAAIFAAVSVITLIALNAIAIHNGFDTRTISAINTGVFGTGLLAGLAIVWRLKQDDHLDNQTVNVAAFATALFAILTLIGALGLGGVIKSPNSIGWSVNGTVIALAAFGSVVGGGFYCYWMNKQV